MWKLQYDTNEHIYKIKRFTDAENRLVVAKVEGAGGGKDWEFGISSCKLLYKGWDKQQGPTVQHKELCSISYYKP